jgi:hypothetical protein
LLGVYVTESTFICTLVLSVLFTREANVILLFTDFAPVGVTFTAYDLVLSQMFGSLFCKFYFLRVNSVNWIDVISSRMVLSSFFAFDAL